MAGRDVVLYCIREVGSHKGSVEPLSLLRTLHNARELAGIVSSGEISRQG